MPTSCSGMRRAPDEHGNVRPLPAAIGMQVVENQEVDPAAAAMTSRSLPPCRVMSSSSIMKFVSSMSGFAARVWSRSSLLSRSSEKRAGSA
jgi:hypothetical protein